MLLNRTSLSLGNLASKEESRYTLGAISVESEQTVVTNGHYLVSVTHPKIADDRFPETPGLTPKTVASGENVLIARDAAIGAAKALKKSHMPILNYAALSEDRTLYVNQLDGVQSFKREMQGKFPNWRAVMPAKKPVAEICLSAEYVALIASFMAKHGDKRACPIRLTLYGPENAIRFDSRSEDGQDITAVLMPLRASESDFAKRPDHVAAEAKAAKKKVAEEAAKVADANAELASEPQTEEQTGEGIAATDEVAAGEQAAA